MKKYKKLSMLMCSLGLILLLTGVTYSFFNYTKTGNANNLGTGSVSFNIDEGEAISLTNVFPMTASEASEANLDTLTIGISGSTTYASGEEFLISIVDVTKLNNKEIPMSYIATYEETTGNSIGTEEDDYFTERESKSANIYLLNETGRVKEDKQVLVGFIKGGTDGIDGTLTIKAYVDADRIAITDTPTESSDWVAGRQVFSTTEWNSLKGNSAISFKIKAESYTKLWVEEPELDNVTPDACFEKKYTKIYTVNTNMTQTELNDCINYINNNTYLTFDNNGTAEDFCLGTGKTLGDTFQVTIYKGDTSFDKDYLESHNIITSEDGIIISNYNSSCGSDVVIPKTMNYTQWLVNPNMTQSIINDCIDYFTNTLNWSVDAQNGETIAAYCAGTGTIWGKNLQENLNDFSSSNMTFLEEHNIIIEGETRKYPVLSIDSWTFNTSYSLSSLVINNNLKMIYDSALGFKIISPMNSLIIPQSVVYVGTEALIPEPTHNSNFNLTILGKPYIDAYAIRNTFDVSYGGTCQELYDNSAIRYNPTANANIGGYIVIGSYDAESYITTTDTNSCKVYAGNFG